MAFAGRRPGAGRAHGRWRLKFADLAILRELFFQPPGRARHSQNGIVVETGGVEDLVQRGEVEADRTGPRLVSIEQALGEMETPALGADAAAAGVVGIVSRAGVADEARERIEHGSPAAVAPGGRSFDQSAFARLGPVPALAGGRARTEDSTWQQQQTFEAVLDCGALLHQGVRTRRDPDRAVVAGQDVPDPHAGCVVRSEDVDSGARKAQDGSIADRGTVRTGGDGDSDVRRGDDGAGDRLSRTRAAVRPRSAKPARSRSTPAASIWRPCATGAAIVSRLPVGR